MIFENEGLTLEMLPEKEMASIEDLRKDDFSYLRIQKLIATVLAEFMTQKKNCGLDVAESIEL